MASSATAGSMTLAGHLGELRSRLVRAVAALAVGTAVGYAIFPTVLPLLIAPYCGAVALSGPVGECALVALRPLEPFSVRMKASVVAGLFIGGPVIFHQVWRFITPGLTGRERRYALPFVLGSQLMFGLGIAFASLVIPQGLRILLGMGGPRVVAMLSASEYLSFLLTSAVAFGLVFELPLVLILLSLTGLVQVASLRRARPYAVLAMIVVAAIVTPTTDAVTLLLLAAPMLVFYELSILVGWLIERSKRRRGS